MKKGLNVYYGKKNILLFFILLLIVNTVQAQTTWKQKVTNAFSTINSFDLTKYVKGYQIKLNDSSKKNLVKVNAAPTEKKPKTKATNKIHIYLPKISKIYHYFKKDTTLQKISKVNLKQVKENKIDQLNVNILDLQDHIERLQIKKLALENKIKSLNKPDSVKIVLKEDIAYFNKKAQAYSIIPVGYNDIDEEVRNLVLLDKIPTNNNLTIRPYYTNTKLTYQQLLTTIDSSIQYEPTLYKKKSFVIEKLPIQLAQKYNSNRPYGWNDGAMSYSKGYQFQVSGGVFAAWKNFKLQLRPEYVQTASGQYETNGYWGQVNSAYKKFWLGNSSLRFDLGKLSFSASTQNLWWGPGIYNSLLMSNNAEGFFHYSFNTNRPIKNFLGTWQFQIIWAKLTYDSAQGFENTGLKRRIINDKSNRFLNSLALDYQPSFLKNISLGINRSVQSYYDIQPTDYLNKNFPVIGKFFGSTQGQYALDYPQDQLVSVYTKWMLPKSHAEIYYEYAYNDAKQNFRDLFLDMSHSTAYILGFKKLFVYTDKKFLDFGVEVLKLAQTPSYLHRNAGNFYEHSQLLEGYTNQNQIIGAGAGFGNNMQTVQIGLNEGWEKLGVIFHHIQQNPMALVSGVNDLGLRTTQWNDFSYGIQAKHRYKNLLFNANVEVVNSKNYLWQEHNNITNFYFYLNTILLW